MTAAQKRLIELSTVLPDADDRAVCLIGARAIAVLREVGAQVAGYDELSARVLQGALVAPARLSPPHGDY